MNHFLRNGHKFWTFTQKETFRFRETIVPRKVSRRIIATYNVDVRRLPHHVPHSKGIKGLNLFLQALLLLIATQWQHIEHDPLSPFIQKLSSCEHPNAKSEQAKPRLIMHFKIAAMTSTTLLWILVALFKPSYQESISYGACLNDGSVPAPTLPCEPRDVVIQLDLPNNSYFHVAPDHVTVKRCIGSCNFDR